MLILSRKVGESIFVGDDIEIIVTEIKGDQIKIGIKAPKSIDIIRGEIRKEISLMNNESLAKNLDSLLSIKKNNE